MHKSTLILLFISIIFISCSNDNSENANIKGTLKNAAENTPLYLQKIGMGTLTNVDTATTDENGNFYFDYSVPEKGFYRVGLNGQTYINLVFEPNEKVTLTLDANDFVNNYEVTGSEESNLLRTYNFKIRDSFFKRDSLNRLFQVNAAHPKRDSVFAALKIMMDNEYFKLVEYTVAMIEAHPASWVSYAALEQINAEEHIELVKKVTETFREKYPGSEPLQSLEAKLKSLMFLAHGNEAPDIVLTDTEGKERKLSDLKGKIVLIDFWASWCRPCRSENPNVVAAYKKYHSKGFEVFSVSLDGVPQQADPKSDWLKAIEQDGLIWENHVSDLKGWNSPVVNLYGFKGIPFTVLIDKEGKIIGKNIRGEALHKKLAILFDEK